MKKVKKSSKHEPTISDVLEVVQTGFARHEGLLMRHDKALVALHEGQESLKELLNDRTNSLDRRLSNTQNRVEDIADTLEDFKHSTRKGAITILDHERRIRHLEQVRK